MVLAAVAAAGNARAEHPDSAEPQQDVERAYSPVVRDTTATNLYWGDTHLHTNNSGDAFALGNESLSGEDAFRFARGEEVRSSSGQPVKLRRPLDFLAVSDHAEYLGVHVLAKNKSPLLDSWEQGKRWAELLATGAREKMMAEFANLMVNHPVSENIPASVLEPVWHEVIATADRFNDPGHFTAFSAYEWTSNVGGDNLHRVVLFKDGADKVGRVLPFSGLESTDPERLWAALEAYERETEGEVIAIPHNGNLSNGRMFAPRTLQDDAFTPDYAATRSRWEPVVEVTQMKGDSETHPTLSPTDEFANFERWDTSNVAFTQPKQPWMLQYEYARSALREGLRHEAALGTNPFKFGMIGGTDSHTGLSTAVEGNFFGKYAESEPGRERLRHKIGRRYIENWQVGASGLAAVWASENTREAIFEAFERREVYATTGSRIALRFFGGWEFDADDVLRPEFVRLGYRNGVPMGGDLKAAPKGRSPRFMVMAARDPDGANLDRIQIVKGWLDAQGESHEAIYDVALSDGRRVDLATGKAPPVVSTVDVDHATYYNRIGDAELAAVWTDPDFDPGQRAFYYVRVIEIPTPRWTAYDVAFFGKSAPPNVPMVVQDRAYSSPIWYMP